MQDVIKWDFETTDARVGSVLTPRVPQCYKWGKKNKSKDMFYEKYLEYENITTLRFMILKTNEPVYCKNWWI